MIQAVILQWAENTAKLGDGIKVATVVNSSLKRKMKYKEMVKAQKAECVKNVAAEVLIHDLH